MSNVGVYHYLEVRSETTASAGFNSVWNYIAIFALMQTASGDTVDAIQQQMGTSMSEEAKTALRHEMGLDQPFIVQYFQWVGKIFTGIWGILILRIKEVFPMFMQALPNTLLLTLSSIVTTIVISIP